MGSLASAGTVEAAKPRARAWQLLRRRGPRGFLRALLSHLRARWYLRRATRVGAVRLHGRALVTNWGGDLRFEDGVRLDGGTVRLEFVCFPRARLQVGAGTYINYGSTFSASERVEIGRNCVIGQYAIVMDNDYHDVEDHRALGASRPVRVEDDVWLGARVTVLPGAHIGRGAVIGAHSVVRGEIPAYTLAAGAPARVIRRLRSAESPEPPASR